MFLLEIPPSVPREPLLLVDFEMKSKHSGLQGKVYGGFSFFNTPPILELQIIGCKIVLLNLPECPLPSISLNFCHCTKKCRRSAEGVA